MSRSLIALILLLHSFHVAGQQMSKVSIIPTREDFFYTCIDNGIEVFARQRNPITLDKIKAFQITGYTIRDDDSIHPQRKEIELSEDGSNRFKLHIPAGAQIIQFEVKLDRGLEVVKAKVYPLPIKLRLGSNYLSDGKKIKAIALKHMPGITNDVDFRGLCAFGKITGFTIMGIIDNQSKGPIFNDGARFNDDAKQLISSMTERDFLIIKDLKYQTCGHEIDHGKNYIIELK